MKVKYVERIERHRAFSRKMRCPYCGSTKYEVVEELQPSTTTPWYVRCSKCEAESYMSPARDIAIARWKQIC